VQTVADVKLLYPPAHRISCLRWR